MNGAHALSALAALCVLLLPASAAAAPAQLRLINLVQQTDTVHVRLCREADDACRTVSLVADAAGDTLSLQAGRYRFEVRVHGHVASHFRYGLGDGESYGLALYGVYMLPMHQSWLIRVKTALGGSDRRQVTGPWPLRLAQLLFALIQSRPARGHPGERRPVQLAIAGSQRLKDENRRDTDP